MSTGQDRTAHAASDTAKASIVQASTALLQAVNGSDSARVLSLWCDDGVLMPPHHPSVRGRVMIGEYFDRLFKRGRFEFAFGSSEVEVAGEIAVQRVEYTASFWPADGSTESRDAGKGLHVYRRQANGEWRLVMDIWNSDAAAVAATEPTAPNTRLHPTAAGRRLRQSER